MRILFYCQHVLGMGHFFRALEICRALAGHEVVLVSGGLGVGEALPGHARLFPLPPLSMDEDFSGLVADADVAAVKQERREKLLALARDFSPDVFLAELFPFGRKAFSFELLPLLETLSTRRPRPLVASSVRDILVEKKDPAAWEERVAGLVNRWFDLVLVHADPRVARLSESFTRAADLSAVVEYTGYVARMPAPGARERARASLGLSPGDRLCVVSAGGGRVGGPLLEASARALSIVNARGHVYGEVTTGPYLPDGEFARLSALAGPRTRVRRFIPDFADFLAGADLSVSMAGYNTCMNILAARVPALVWPFGQNREQGMRAQRLADLGALSVLSGADLDPEKLAARMEEALASPPGRPDVDLTGAETTARILWRRVCGERAS